MPDRRAVITQQSSLFADADQAQAWLAERFVDEDDPREPKDVPLLELIQKVYDWGDEAWHHAGKELERADEANSRLYRVSERARSAEAVAREALALAREVYSWAVHEPNTRRLRERAEALEARLGKDRP